MQGSEWVELLNGKRAGNDAQFIARCPAHDDHHASLSINTADPTKTLLHCQAGCTTESVVAAVGKTMADLYTQRTANHAPIAVYAYTDIAGKATLEKRRYANKDFRWFHMTADGWASGIGGVTPKLYMVEDIGNSPRVFWVEGEKDVSTVRAYGKAAVCIHSGANGKPTKEQLEPLRGREVVILPDNDDAGKAHADNVSAALRGVARSVKVLDLTMIDHDLPPKADITDLVEKHGADVLAKVEAMCASLPEAGTKPLMQFYAASELDEKEFAPPPFVVSGMLPAGLTVLAAPPKTGKSWLCLDLCCAVAEGMPFWGLDTDKGSTLYLDLEGREWRVKTRFEAMQRKAPAGLYLVHEVPRLGEGLLEQLDDWAKRVPNPRLIVIDTIARVKAFNRRGETSYDGDTRMFAPLQGFALECGIAVLAITHLRKSSGLAVNDPFEAITGSMGQFGTADGAWLISGARADAEKRFLATGRDYEPVELAITFSRDKCRWEALGDCEALQEARARSEYDSSPLVQTIRKLVQEGGGMVRCTASDLYQNIATQTGQYPAETPTALGLLLRKTAAMFARYDGIYYCAPCKNGGNGGRQHTFTQKPLSLYKE